MAKESKKPTEPFEGSSKLVPRPLPGESLLAYLHRLDSLGLRVEKVNGTAVPPYEPGGKPN